MRGVVAFATEQDAQTRSKAAAANETWLAYPDDDPVRTVTSGADSRAALAPLLAHRVSKESYTDATAVLGSCFPASMSEGEQIYMHLIPPDVVFRLIHDADCVA